MKEIDIKQTEREEPVFRVIVTDKAGNKTRHAVSLSDNYYDNLTHGKISRMKLIEMSFEFLLKRESGDSIFSEFDLQEIMRYYPEYDRYVRNQMAHSK